MPGNSFRRLTAFFESPYALAGVLILAFFARIAGILYGLPLTVVNDEYPFTYAALQMLQLHTVIPALHADAFVNILPYPPYLSYLLLVPFAAIVGMKLLVLTGPDALFPAHLLSDLTPFFATARLLHVVLGVLSIYLIYRVAEHVFRSRIAAIASAFLLATSLLHAALSMVGRNWLPTSFIFLLVLYFLTREGTVTRRYIFAFMAAGIGMGISSIAALACLMMGLYYLCFDLKDAKLFVRDLPSIAGGIAVFAVLAIIPWLLWHGGNAFLGATTLFAGKSLAGALASPLTALSLTVWSEPVVMLLFLGGLIGLYVRARRVFFFVVGFFLLYVGVFYFFFRFDARFLLPVVPLYALAGGFAIAQLWSRKTALLLCVVLLVPLIASARLAYLAATGDTRQIAREWTLQHIESGDKVLVYSSALHVPTQAAAVAELRSIDERVLRKVDEADEALDRDDVPYALNNLTSLVGTPFLDTLPEYAKREEYSYLILEPRSLLGSSGASAAFAALTKDAAVIAHFSGLGTRMSLWESAFTEPLPRLFDDKRLGPDILIYKLK